MDNDNISVNDHNTAEIFFQSGIDKPWIMKMGRVDGGVRIQFNRHDYPDAAPDEFAQAVIEILEGSRLFDELRAKTDGGGIGE